MMKKNILVVDDDTATTDITRLILESHGHHVDVSNSGKGAIEKVVECQPDLVVLDITMPDMDGFSVCKFIKSHPALHQVKVILLTSQDRTKTAAKTQEAGADAFLEKPCDVEELIVTMNRLLIPV